MDGTLLNNSRKISEGNKARIRQAVADGMIFTIATGRMY
ncbi:MAG: HAD family hydrolase, partial [Selenomonadaceae bacterium]